MLGTSITKNSILLGLFAMLTTLLIASTYLSTKDRIAEAQRQAEQKALLEIVPKSRHNNSMLDETVTVGPEDILLQLSATKKIYIARQDNNPVAAILPAVAAEGYSGAIEVIVGINIDGTIAGVRTLSHKETPGLGDKVDIKKSDWILGFNGKSLVNPKPDLWRVKKDKGVFDQFTGATITPRAVTKAVYASLLYFDQNRQEIFSSSKKQHAIKDNIDSKPKEENNRG
jgi:electron transport complex protein RnfG